MYDVQGFRVVVGEVSCHCNGVDGRYCLILMAGEVPEVFCCSLPCSIHADILILGQSILFGGLDS